jgi:hypothetical protein
VGGAHAKAARGPVVTKVPTVGQFIHRWLEETVARNLAPLTYAKYEIHVKNYIEPESMPCGLIVFASQMSRRGSIATSCSLSMAEVATDMVCCSSQWVPCHFDRQIGLEPSYLGTSAEPPDKTCKRCWYSCSLISPRANRCAAICCGESSAGDEEAV